MTVKPKKAPPKKRKPPAKPKRKPRSAANIATIDPKRKIFEAYVNRIAAGRTLKPSEIKLFRQLDAELNGVDGANGQQPGEAGPIVPSMDDAARYAGQSRTTIVRAVNQGKLKKQPDGTFKRSDLDDWIKSRYGASDGTDESTKEKQDKADLRYRLARAKREEILTAQLEGTMAPWEEIKSAWRERVLEVTAGLEAFADRLPAVLVGKSRDEVHQIIKAECRELRERYNREGRYCPIVKGGNNGKGKSKTRSNRKL